MKRYVYDTVDISIAVGQPSFSKNVSLRDGKCVGVRFIDFSSATPRAHAINMNVNDSNTSLTGNTDFRNYTNSGGGHEENYMPVLFDTKAEVTVDVNSSQAIADADFEGQLIFKIEVECNA